MIPTEVGVGWKISAGWSPEVPHSIKYLGCHIDSNNLYETIFQETLIMIRQMCRTIGRKKASAEVKASAATLRVKSMATYRGAVGPWSLEKLREWDKPLESLYRKISKCMKSFPTQLLYTSADQCGLGFTCLSDRIQEEKFARLHRCITSGGNSKVAADGLLLRSARACGRPVVAGQRTIITPTEGDSWPKSLLDWGAQVGKHIHLGGPDPLGTVLAPVADILGGDSDKETLLVGCDIVTLGDLVQDKATENGHVREWLPKDTLDGTGLKGIHSVLRRCPLPTGDITIRVGNCLCLEGSADVLEFLGWVEDLACVRRWSPVSRIDNCSVNSR